MCLISTELTQDIASRGLGLVYESCDGEQKQSLVTALVDTLMTGKRLAIFSLHCYFVLYHTSVFIFVGLS